jgi:DNA-binding transcriptional MerR regulator
VIAMPIKIKDKTFYRTSEVCQMVHISRSTLLRWLEDEHLNISGYRDRRSWRLFTLDDINKLACEANRISREQNEIEPVMENVDTIDIEVRKSRKHEKHIKEKIQR